jgi:hypothetical protein
VSWRPSAGHLGPSGKGEMTNYRVKDQMYIVDRLFDRGQLVLGSGKKARRRWRSVMGTAKDNSIPPVRPIESPTQLEIRPQPKNVVRLSRRGGLALGGVGLLLLAVFAYGGYKRTEQAQREAREQAEPKRVAPATQAALEITKSAPTGDVSLRSALRRPDELQPPEDSTSQTGTISTQTCGIDLKTGRFVSFQSANR